MISKTTNLLFKNTFGGLYKNIYKVPQGSMSKMVTHRISEDNTDSVPFDFTKENYQEIEKILQKYPSNYKRSAVMPLLYLAQNQNNNWVPLSAMKKIAKILQIPDMDVYEVASFYTMYNREPVGKFHLQLCGTTPCMLCGSTEVIKAVQEYTKTTLGHTSADGLWTLDEVECLGACANAPMMQVNNEWVYQDLTPENVIQLLEDLKNGKERKGPQNNRINCGGPQGQTSLLDQPQNLEVKQTRDFAKAQQEWLDQKEKERLEAEKQKAQAAAAATAAQQ